ncbi:glycine cleavage system aminomethyltransferase GcvT [Paenibacillus sp.]|uniref:glycine cleavage system aminomethyltransferase GcvT n=1 Tax=Paenibacillus sp. TaxID=58172 RepID=UPI002D2A8D87|nr:glycine cleavage system aminomethyltransferase GcvT [Paenibacillus sp.]HZG56564.1 glycine cleavage system aminomethyltransferase GcvT [Paenibacillus sp.]
MTERLKRTPLYPLYAARGAKTIDFGGWELPVQFEGILKEHEAVRQRAGLFDVSHMGEFLVSGPDAAAFLQRLTTNDVAKLAVGAAQYTLMCYPDGGTVDDLLVYRLASDRFLLVVNAANLEKDWAWLQRHVEGETSLENVSDETALLAVQGPAAAAALLAAVDGGAGAVAALRPFRFAADASVGGVPALVSRTGYTGEDGFELYVPADGAAKAWEALLSAGAPHGLVPVGLGARDTLRFEARLPLYGQELSASITPLEAGLHAFVKLGKGEFIGREALAAQHASGLPRRLVGLEMVDRGIPRTGHGVFAADGSRVGEVTTGTQSPTLKRNLGLALVDAALTATGTELYVDVRGKRLKAKIVETPFYKRQPKLPRTGEESERA